MIAKAGQSIASMTRSIAAGDKEQTRSLDSVTAERWRISLVNWEIESRCLISQGEYLSDFERMADVYDFVIYENHNITTDEKMVKMPDCWVNS